MVRGWNWAERGSLAQDMGGGREHDMPLMCIWNGAEMR